MLAHQAVGRAPLGRLWGFARLVSSSAAGSGGWLGMVFGPPAQSTGPQPLLAARSPAEQGAHWAELKPAQQSALKPLEHEWVSMDAPQKQKWLELSTRFPKMTEPERARVQERMTAWTNLTPQQRGQARLRFQEAKLMPSQDRQARWNAYQALSPEEKRQLADRATPPSGDADRRGTGLARAERPMREMPQPKSNIVPNPSFEAPPKAIAPTVLQARLGATTTPITRRPAPPSHQQPGLPKIAATPEFVNKATLLPRRGPQGAATRSAAAPVGDRALAR